jgi:integrase
MAKATLTEERIREARATGKRYLWEVLQGEEVKHGNGSLGVYLGKHGLKYIYKYSVPGSDGKKTELQVTIGTGEDLTLTAARKRALQYYDKRTKGEDVASYKAERIATEKRFLVADNFEKHFRDYLAKRRRDFSPRYAHLIEVAYKKHLAGELGTAKISSIKPSKLKAIIYSRSDDVGRFLYTFLKPFFDWCLDHDFITASPIAEVKRPKPAKMRDRALKGPEIAALWRSADAMGYPFGPFYKLLLLTAQRRDEVSGMRWQEIDFDRREWIIPKQRTKSEREHVVHLSEQALAVLRAVERRDSPFVFTTTLKTPISGYSKAKAQLDDLMQADMGRDVEEWRVHDLRHTAATIMGELGALDETIELVLNHQKRGLVKNYNHSKKLAARKEALIDLGTYIEQLVRPTPASDINVIRLLR